MTVVVPSHVPNCLKDIRIVRGYSVRDAAKIASISPATFHRAERGGVMDAKTLIALTAFIKSRGVA